MIVIVVAACPIGLRGHLTRWLMEISTGVFVGRVSARVRGLLWVRVVDMVKTGRAILVYAANNEQGLAFEVHNHDWKPIDVEGLTLMLRPSGSTEDARPGGAVTAKGWSAASKRRRFGKR